MPKMLNKIEQQFLEENEDLIANGQWENLYQTLRNSPAPTQRVIQLYDILMGAGIDLLKEYLICPGGYAAHAETLPAELNIPEGVESIGRRAFFETQIEKVHLPGTIKSIGEGAFIRCENLTSINIPADVASLGMNAFKGCDSLVDVKFAKTSKIRNLEEGVFEHTGLENIVLPEGIVTIWEAAFKYCYYLTTLGLPKSLQTIKSWAITGAQFLKKITYVGTRKEFKKIDLEPNWLSYPDMPIVIECSDGDLKILAGEVVD